MCYDLQIFKICRNLMLGLPKSSKFLPQAQKKRISGLLAFQILKIFACNSQNFSRLRRLNCVFRWILVLNCVHSWPGSEIFDSPQKMLGPFFDYRGRVFVYRFASFREFSISASFRLPQEIFAYSNSAWRGESNDIYFEFWSQCTYAKVKPKFFGIGTGLEPVPEPEPCKIKKRFQNRNRQN